MKVLFAEAKKVYRGKIITAKKITDENSKFDSYHAAEVLTTEVFKGKVDLPEKIYISNSSAACGFDDLTPEMIFFVLADGSTASFTGTFPTRPVLAEGSFMYDELKARMDKKIIEIYKLRERKK